MFKEKFMKIRKSAFGWTADTLVQIDDEVRLCITTMKRSSGMVTTTATCSRKEGEMYYFTVCKDYRMTWAVSPAKATQKAITIQHELIVSQIEKIKYQCVVFYTNLRETT